MKREAKQRIISQLSERLKLFDIAYDRKFLCPVCMKQYPIDNLKMITEAHIIPASVGGTETSWLCKKCNNEFGAKQDRWMSEYIAAVNAGTLFTSGVTKDKYVTVDNHRLPGDIVMNGTGIDVRLFSNRIQETKREEIKRSLMQRNGSFNVSVKMPLLSNRKLVDVGFLTAAYLIGFSYFGYSWVLQNHFEGIRQVIRGETNLEDSVVLVSNLPNDIDKSTIYFCFAKTKNEYVPAVKLFSKIVLFPPSYRPSAINEFKDQEVEYNVDIKKMNGIDFKSYPAPLGITIGNATQILPDLTRKGFRLPRIVYIDPNCFEATMLHENRADQDPENTVPS